MNKIIRNFFNQSTEVVAQNLLGKLLIKKLKHDYQIGRIVETEAYLGEHDLACHASKGVTNRTKTMYGEPGHAYVHLIYGMYHCFNVVTEPKGHGSAVLIRALEPVLNINLKTDGPGKLCRALDINRAHDGMDLTADEFYFAYPDQHEEISMISTQRIGVQYAKEWALKPLRYYIKNNSYISKP